MISHDPDSGYINVGTYRVQVHDEKTVGLWIIPGKHGNLIAQKYWGKGEDCPFSIACGVPPSMMLASAVGIPWGMGEYNFLGGLLGAPIPIVKSDATGLSMPANAELVLEGLRRRRRKSYVRKALLASGRVITLPAPSIGRW